VGDPKPTAERALNDGDVVAVWVERIRAQIEPYFDFTGENAALLVNNLEWTAPLSALDLLRDIGRHFRVSRMLAKEAVSARLESDSGISYTEFSYQILQGLDFLELFRRHGCTLQTGGSDQWGNLTAGVDLVHRVEGRSLHLLATPLVTKADGTKFGKTEGGTVWLDPGLTSPYAFYQSWINVDDRDVVAYLKFFSFRSRGEIEELAELTRSRPQARSAQRALAEELTTLVHGANECERAVAASRALFGQGSLSGLDERTLSLALAELPRWAAMGTSVSVVDALVGTGLSPSRAAARRTIKEGGAYLNNEQVTSEDATLDGAAFLQGHWAVLRRGKRHCAAVEHVR
jgi:tyrosyl-tRNA synthetase